MLRITKQADYAIVLLSHFITDGIEGDYTARGLSAATGIPLPMVGKILKALVHRGLLISHRGAKGGYQLAREADGISVAAIIEAIDGPIGLTTCSVHSGECAHEGRCPSRPNWNRINAAVLQSLRGISLADMTRPMSFPHLTPAAQPLAGEIA